MARKTKLKRKVKEKKIDSARLRGRSLFGETKAREELKSLEEWPLVGGLLKGLEKFVDLVEKTEEAGGEIIRKGEIKGKQGARGVYRVLIKTGLSPFSRGAIPRLKAGNRRQKKK